jgi:hypothetical protein
MGVTSNPVVSNRRWSMHALGIEPGQVMITTRWMPVLRRAMIRSSSTPLSR